MDCDSDRGNHPAPNELDSDWDDSVCLERLVVDLSLPGIRAEFEAEFRIEVLENVKRIIFGLNKNRAALVSAGFCISMPSFADYHNSFLLSPFGVNAFDCCDAFGPAANPLPPHLCAPVYQFEGPFASAPPKDLYGSLFELFLVLADITMPLEVLSSQMVEWLSWRSPSTWIPAAASDLFHQQPLYRAAPAVRLPALTRQFANPLAHLNAGFQAVTSRDFDMLVLHFHELVCVWQDRFADVPGEPIVHLAQQFLCDLEMPVAECTPLLSNPSPAFLSLVAWIFVAAGAMSLPTVIDQLFEDDLFKNVQPFWALPAEFGGDESMRAPNPSVILPYERAAYSVYEIMREELKLLLAIAASSTFVPEAPGAELQVVDEAELECRERTPAAESRTLLVCDEKLVEL